MEYGFFDVLKLIGSLGLFLFGMRFMSEALVSLAGSGLRAILASMTSNRFLGVSTGFLITSIIQSSSATTLMVVSFSNAGLLTITEAISVIMGANIGTTVTAWLIAILGFKVNMGAIALPLVGLGILFTFSKKVKTKFFGEFVVGFALLFIGLQFLKESMPDINSNPQILQLLSDYTHAGYGSILLFLLIGTLITIIIQSSSATLALTILMTAQGWIPFELAAAMILGENIGTTVTANLASIVANYHAKRTARAHLIFNLIGVIWMLALFHPFLNMISELSQWLGTSSPYRDPAAVPVAISLFHTIFNIINTLLLIWFVGLIGKLVVRLVKARIPTEKAIEEPKFLNKKALRYPETVIASLMRETEYLFKNTIFEIVCHALNIHRKDITSQLKAREIVEKSKEDFKTDVRALYLSKVKSIYGEIIRYATHAQSTLKLTEEQTNRILEIKLACRRMVEIIRDVGELNRNVSIFLESDNEYIKKEYDQFRKKAIKVLRIILLFRDEEDKEKYRFKLKQLKKEAGENIRKGNIEIDYLIRDELISTDMASSLVNDHDNLNKLIARLIEVAELVYSDTDPVLDELNPRQDLRKTAVLSK